MRIDHANIARFTLEEGEIGPEYNKSKRKDDGQEHAARKEEVHLGRNASTFFNGNRSFRDTLTGRQGTSKELKTVIVDSQLNAFRGLHGKALVARMIDLDALKSIYLILNEICPGLGRVQYLGGLSVTTPVPEPEPLTTSVPENKMEDGLNPIAGDCEGVSATESVLPEETSNSGKETPAAGVGPEKKSFLGSVGRPNPAYSSSLEKTKVGKKPKCDEVGTLQIAPEDVSVDEAEDLSEGVDISSEGTDRPGYGSAHGGL
ncbi:hypothetical protein L1987_51530 [Smallanthus sonchifolius]|uniref:Uncharacterized protein n=1 Tax=Smallanthus sonchifolius TaxID=185202 RepID=A0ACB9EQI7_9ASTR|nr:hypothetical protein L1987_51530 [Smallanthus sonchifolius]